MKLKYTSNYGKAIDRIEKLKQRMPEQGRQWVGETISAMNQDLRVHLGEQGRNGAPPPLSGMTREIYRIDGEPDGSGITNHITLEYKKREGTITAILGIPTGKPTLIAKVQDQGATIRVTDKMRGFLAANYGIYLRQETTHIHIPGRYFWSTVLRKTRSQALRKLRRFFQRALR